ncbi:protein TonB [Bacteroidia bacterium]|nr:protein TonB [Bacteroidia bacterium]
MEIKKAAQANLENERGTFLVLGLVFALSTLFVALEWSFDTEPSPEDFDLSAIYIESELTAPIVTPKIPAAVEATEVKPKKIETPPAIVHEDYKVVKEEPEEVPEEVPVEAQPEEPPPAPPPAPEPPEPLSTEPDAMPTFPGGLSELNRYLFLNTKYPATAVSAKRQGRVWCSFVVEKDGSITNIVIEQGTFADLNEEVLRVFQAMPPWVPGVEGGKPVRVKCYHPIVFQLGVKS